MFYFPEFNNEPVLTFAPGSDERNSVVKVKSNVFVWFQEVILISFFTLSKFYSKIFVFTFNKAIDELKASKYDIPIVIGGEEYRTAEKKEQLCVSTLCPIVV